MKVKSFSTKIAQIFAKFDHREYNYVSGIFINLYGEDERNEKVYHPINGSYDVIIQFNHTFYLCF